MKWFRFYHDAIDDPKVQRLEPALFKFWVNMLCLASRSDERGTVTLEVEEIAFALRINDEEARTHLDALIAAGLLESGDAGLEIHNWGERQRQSDDVAQRVAKHRRSGKRRPPADETLPETLPETENPSARDRGERDADPEESETSRAHAREAGADAPDTDVSTRRFELFWSVYPRKVGRGAAERWWRKRKPTQALTETIVAAVRRQLQSDQWQRDGGQYIPNPTTWLNQERWHDELPPPNGRGRLHARDPNDVSASEWLDMVRKDATR